MAAFGGVLAQGRATFTTMDVNPRNPGASGNMFVPMILGLALIESQVIYSLVIRSKMASRSAPSFPSENAGSGNKILPVRPSTSSLMQTACLKPERDSTRTLKWHQWRPASPSRDLTLASVK